MVDFKKASRTQNSFKKIEEMLKLQDSFNKKVNPNWKEQDEHNYDWKSCIICEVAEAIESLAYKHWKKQEVDFENLEVEAIDIYHFLMSLHLRNCRNEVDVMDLADIYMYSYDKVTFTPEFSSSKDNPKNIKSVLKELVFALGFDESENNIRRKTINLQLKTMFIIFRLMGWNIDDVYNRYIVKNVLNIFRQNNGYKEGTYIKMWDGVEDNVIAYKLIKDIKEDVFNKLYERLNEEYNKIKRV